MSLVPLRSRQKSPIPSPVLSVASSQRTGAGAEASSGNKKIGRREIQQTMHDCSELGFTAEPWDRFPAHRTMVTFKITA